MEAEAKKKLLGRVKRAQGQLAAIHRMLENGEDCPDLLLQLAAVRGALGRVGEMVLRTHLETCMRDTLRNGNLSQCDQMVDKLVEVFARYGGMGAK